MNQERWQEVESKTLFTGSGASIDHACIMQMVSYVANEPWSDHPECACPILTEYAIRMNDKFNDEHRQLMKPFIPLLIGTRSTREVQIARKRLLRWRYVTAVYPVIMEARKMPDIAAQLRLYENTLESMALAKEFLTSQKEKISANADAYADADAYAYAYADADAYAYADADADAYAYAKTIRSTLAALALETLKMAIEVKESSSITN